MGLGNELVNYFSFGRARSTAAGGKAIAMSAESAPSHRLLNVGLQYAAVALGVVLQPVIAEMLKNQAPTLHFLTSARVWGSLAIAMLIFPGAYRPNQATTPPFVQFCVLFGAGVGWQAIVQSMLK
jgi:hypothetical protein